MSPKQKHIPDDAQRTSVCLTIEDKAAIEWIRASRKRVPGAKHITINDVLVDALWYYVEKEYGRTKEQIQASVPPPIPRKLAKITPISKKKH